MMALDEQKLKICEKLPELIHPRYRVGEDCAAHFPIYYVWNKEGTKVNWPTEGLQICHEWICRQIAPNRRKIDSMLAAKAKLLFKTQAELTWKETIEEIVCFLQEYGGE